MNDAVNMSLDEIIKQNQQQNRASRTRGRGGGTMRGRGGLRGGRGRGGGGRGGGGGNRGRSQSRSGTPGPWQGRSRSRNGRQNRSQSRGRSQSQARSQSRGRSQSQARSRSRQRRNTYNSRSRSRSRLRGLTPRGRAGLEEQAIMPPLVNRRGGFQMRLRRSNSNPNLQGSVHSRLGMTTRRGGLNLRSPNAAKRGIGKRGRGLTTANRYSNVGLRSDQILREKQRINNIIQSQTFRNRSRSRNNSFNGPSNQLTVSVANDFGRRRRNSVGSGGYLNQQSLAQFNNQFGGYNTRRGPGSVRSMGSNRSNKSYRSNRSNQSNRSNRSRGRGRGRGANRGVGRKFVNKQILNPKLQKEIAAIQGKSYGEEPAVETPGGISFTPVPNATKLTLHQRFASK